MPEELCLPEWTANGDMLQSILIAYDTNGRRSSCFHTNHYCLISQESVTAASELLETKR